MRFLGNFFFKSFCSILIGLLLIVKADVMPPLLIMLIGGLFLLPGLFGLSTWILSRLSPKSIIFPSFPLASIGSILFGALLIAFPDYFVHYLVILLGIMITLAGISQFSGMWINRTVSPMSWILIFVPIILIGVGLYCIFHTYDAASKPFQLLGCMCIYYGLSDMFLGLRQRHYSKVYAKEFAARQKAEQMAREAEDVEFEVVNAKE